MNSGTSNFAGLIASYYTLAGNIRPFQGVQISPRSLVERARAAAGAGYSGLGFVAEDVGHLIASHRVGEVNRILDDHGIRYREIEFLADWFATGARRRASDVERRRLLDAAGAIGARHVKVTGDLTGKTWPIQQMIEEFARLCDDAAEAGTAVTIELMPTTNLSDLQVGRAIVEGAGRSNGGLLLDSWHMVRGRITMQGIASLPGHLINHVELNDGTLYPVGDFFEETLTSRVAPGEGAFPLSDFLDALTRAGYRGTIGIELFSDAFREMPLEEAAARSTAGLPSLLG